MKIKQKLNSIVLAGSVLAIFLILFPSTAAAFIPSDVATEDTQKLEDMKEVVQQLVDRNTLAEGTGAKWTKLLDIAETAINDDNAIKAKSSLNQFIKTVEPYLKKKSLSRDSKEKISNLIENAKDIRSSLS